MIYLLFFFILFIYFYFFLRDLQRPALIKLNKKQVDVDVNPHQPTTLPMTYGLQLYK